MDFVSILVVVVMIVALIGMIVCAKKQKTNPNAQPIAVGLLIVVIISGLALMYRTGIFGSGGAEKFREIENRYYASQGFVVGKYIAKNFAGKKILVIADKNFEKNARTKLLVDAIKEGTGGKDSVVVDTITLSNQPKRPKPPQGAPPEMMDMPLFELMTAKDFDNAIKKHSDCGVVISTIGLPRDAVKMALWRSAKRPAFILMGGADLRGMGATIKKGLIAAVVTVSPTAKFTEDAPPSDPQKAFDTRYILVNKDNVDKYSKIFK